MFNKEELQESKKTKLKRVIGIKFFRSAKKKKPTLDNTKCHEIPISQTKLLIM